MLDTLVQIIIIVAVLIIAWMVAARFSPDPLITKIVQIIIFIVALLVVIQKILPLAGISF